MAKRDFYETLGISKTASESDIKKAFRSKAKELHPDKNAGSSKAEEEFKAVNEAYEILKDPNKKAAYDQYGHAAFENGGFGNASGGADFSSAFSDVFEDLFGDFMGGGSRRSSGSSSRRGSDLRYDLQVEFEDRSDSCLLDFGRFDSSFAADRHRDCVYFEVFRQSCKGEDCVREKSSC